MVHRYVEQSHKMCYQGLYQPYQDTIVTFIPCNKNTCFIYKTNIGTHITCNSTTSIPPTCFEKYITINREYNTPSYFKHVKIWNNSSSRYILYCSDICSNVHMMTDAVKPSKKEQSTYLKYCWRLHNCIQTSKWPWSIMDLVPV